jgi:hypothetical protein
MEAFTNVFVMVLSWLTYRDVVVGDMASGGSTEKKGFQHLF